MERMKFCMGQSENQKIRPKSSKIIVEFLIILKVYFHKVIFYSIF